MSGSQESAARYCVCPPDLKRRCVRGLEWEERGREQKMCARARMRACLEQGFCSWYPKPTGPALTEPSHVVLEGPKADINCLLVHIYSTRGKRENVWGMEREQCLQSPTVFCSVVPVNQTTLCLKGGDSGQEVFGALIFTSATLGHHCTPTTPQSTLRSTCIWTLLETWCSKTFPPLRITFLKISPSILKHKIDLKCRHQLSDSMS